MGGRIWIAIYGLGMFLGGVMGYARAKSVPSLIAGIASGIVLGAAYVIAARSPRSGYGLSAVAAAALAVTFVHRYTETHKAMPSLGLLGLSVIAAVLFITHALRARS